MDQQKKQRLSMIRSYMLADLLTLGNASCGAVTIFLCLGYIARERAADLRAAFILPIVALVFDALDGYVARLNKRRQSLLGADLDSLADIVSFGVAPADNNADRSRHIFSNPILRARTTNPKIREWYASRWSQ